MMFTGRLPPSSRRYPPPTSSGASIETVIHSGTCASSISTMAKRCGFATRSSTSVSEDVPGPLIEAGVNRKPHSARAGTAGSTILSSAVPRAGVDTRSVAVRSGCATHVCSRSSTSNSYRSRVGLPLVRGSSLDSPRSTQVIHAGSEKTAESLSVSTSGPSLSSVVATRPGPVSCVSTNRR